MGAARGSEKKARGGWAVPGRLVLKEPQVAAVEERGPAGGGGERRAGEGGERLERGREEGGKETSEPLVRSWGERWAGIRGGSGSVGGTSSDWSGGGICLTVDPRGSGLSWLRLGPPTPERSFAGSKLPGRAASSRGV